MKTCRPSERTTDINDWYRYIFYDLLNYKRKEDKKKNKHNKPKKTTHHDTHKGIDS